MGNPHAKAELPTNIQRIIEELRTKIPGLGRVNRFEIRPCRRGSNIPSWRVELRDGELIGRFTSSKENTLHSAWILPSNGETTESLYQKLYQLWQATFPSQTRTSSLESTELPAEEPVADQVALTELAYRSWEILVECYDFDQPFKRLPGALYHFGLSDNRAEVVTQQLLESGLLKYDQMANKYTTNQAISCSIEIIDEPPPDSVTSLSVGQAAHIKLHQLELAQLAIGKKVKETKEEENLILDEIQKLQQQIQMLEHERQQVIQRATQELEQLVKLKDTESVTEAALAEYEQVTQQVREAQNRQQQAAQTLQLLVSN